MRYLICVILITVGLSTLPAQESICVNPATQRSIESENLRETRDYWISLPFRYSDTLSYPVIYVLDAEWRFDLTRHIIFDQGANGIIANSIVIGIPHLEVATKRGQDLTFSTSTVEYNGARADSTTYNATNSGRAVDFYKYLTGELIPDVNKHYATNGHETLIGHSYGGYFSCYLLSLEHPFEVIHAYDPSIWFSDGEVIERVKRNFSTTNEPVRLHLTYQPKHLFHRAKIETLIRELQSIDGVKVSQQFYPYLSHNALYLDSFYNGLRLTHLKD